MTSSTNDLTITEVINSELGMSLSPYRDVNISSPFRNDSDPSFRVYTETNSCYDFGTGESYTIPQFIMELYGYSYWEAINYISSKYGVDLSSDKKDPSDTGLNGVLLIMKLNDESILNVKKTICSYLKGDRNFSEKMIMKYENEIRI